MSMDTLTAGHSGASSFDVSSTAKVPMTRLARVELRKALDTNAGRWFTVSILALVLVVLTILAFAGGEGVQTFQSMLSVAGGVLGYFMPILIIMLVTSEASQRNGLVTFTLEPKRARVVIAKLLAGLALAVLVMVATFLLAIVGTMLGSLDGSGIEWSVESKALINGFLLANLISVLLGFALATLIMNTPAAIVAYFAYTLILPTALGFLTTIWPKFEDIAPWVDFNTAQLPLFTGDYTLNSEEWAQFAVTGVIWLVIPLTLGIWRLLRTEFK